MPLGNPCWESYFAENLDRPVMLFSGGGLDPADFTILDGWNQMKHAVILRAWVPNEFSCQELGSLINNLNVVLKQ